MGQWNISIGGIGAHHNTDLPADANRLAAEFVQKLRDAGHSIQEAHFTYSGKAAGPIGNVPQSNDDIGALDYLDPWKGTPDSTPLLEVTPESAVAPPVPVSEPVLTPPETPDAK